MTQPQARRLTLPDAEIAYDVHGPLPPANDTPALVCVGQPMDASGFVALAARLPGRTVITYDPRGLARSTRADGSTLADPRQQADDLHALVAELGTGPVQVFGSSGGAIAGLAWLQAHPDDIIRIVAHEPPVLTYLPDAQAADRAFADAVRRYAEQGFGPGMAQFIAMTSWQGEFSDDYFAQPPADPAMFGMPTQDDGARDNPLLNGDSAGVPTFRFDADALRPLADRIVLGIGQESAGMFTGRTTEALGDVLGVEPVYFAGGHTGFMPEQWGGKPDTFARQLTERLG